MVYVYLDIYFVGTVVDNVAAEVQQENVPAENVATDNGSLTDAVIRVLNCMHQGSNWYLLWKFKDLFDEIFTNLRIEMMDTQIIQGLIWLNFFDRKVWFIHWQPLFITTLHGLGTIQ